MVENGNTNAQLNGQENQEEQHYEREDRGATSKRQKKSK